MADGWPGTSSKAETFTGSKWPGTATAAVDLSRLTGIVVPAPTPTPTPTPSNFLTVQGVPVTAQGVPVTAGV